MSKPVKKVSTTGKSVWRYERQKPAVYKPPWGVWYAIVCNANCEAKAKRLVERVGVFACYLPMFVSIAKVGGHRKTVTVIERPVFPRYLFVSSKIGPFHSHHLTGLSGVESIVRGPDGRPAGIPHEVIADIMARDLDGRFDLRAKAARDGLAKPHSLTETGFEADQAVVVGSGPLEGLTGKIQGLASGAKLRVLMDIFGRPTTVDIDVTSLEAVA